MSRSHRAAVLAAVLAGFLLVVPACGGSSSSDATRTGTESGAASGTDSSTPEPGDDGQVSAERCQELAAKWQGFIAGPATAVGGGPEDAATLRSQIEELDAQIPAPIAGAFAAVATSTEKVIDLMGGYEDHVHAGEDHANEGEDHANEGEEAVASPGDLDAQLQEVAAITGSTEFTDALAQIEAYFASNCPPA